MALSILQELQQNYLESLLKEGIINSTFRQVISEGQLKEPNIVVEKIHKYFDDIETILCDLHHFIELCDVDYSNLATHARAMEEKSTRMGAEYMRIACAELVQICQKKDREIFFRNLAWVKKEYSFTKEKLDAFAQMEQKIMRLKTKNMQRKESRKDKHELVYSCVWSNGESSNQGLLPNLP